MKIHSLKLKNFMLYKTFNESFYDKDIIGITCKYYDNKHKSNRGGKSTIIEAISYALFGVSRAKKEIDLIHHGQEFMYVELVLIDGDKKYKIKRGRDLKNHGVFEVGLLEKNKESKLEIENLIGFNKNDFLLTNYFKQNDINKFMNLNHADKKNYLMQWLGNDYWKTYEKKVLDILKEKNKRLASLISRHETYQDEIEELDDIKVESEIKNVKNEIEIYKNKLKKHNVLHNKIVEKYNFYFNDYKKCKNTILELETEIENMDEKLCKLNNYESDYLDYKKKVLRLKKDYENFELFNDRLESEVLDEINTQKLEIKSLENEIKNIKDNFCGVCPVTKKSCDLIEKDENHLGKLENELTNRKILKHANLENLQNIRESKNIKDGLDSAKIKLSQLKSKLADKETLKELLSNKNKLLNKHKEEIKNKLDSDIKSKYKKSKNKLDTINNHIYDLQNKLGSNQSILNQIKEMKNKMISIDKDMTSLKKEIENLRYVAFMFSKNGIPSQQIENAFDDIESKINFILRKLETDLQVVFNPEKELSVFESHCASCGEEFEKGKKNSECNNCGRVREKKKKDELHIKIIENSNESNFEMESGGGKTLVSLAVRIALSKLKMNQTNSNFNVIFLDEPDSSLDTHNKNTFIKLITELLIKYFGFEQIFWITHEKNIQESIDNVLQITRYNNHSKTSWV